MARGRGAVIQSNSDPVLTFKPFASRTYVSDLERGSRNPTILIVERLAKMFSGTNQVLIRHRELDR